VSCLSVVRAIPKGPGFRSIAFDFQFPPMEVDPFYVLTSVFISSQMKKEKKKKEKINEI